MRSQEIKVACCRLPMVSGKGLNGNGLGCVPVSSSTFAR